MAMKLHNWKDIRASSKLSPERRAATDRRVRKEVIEMRLRELRELLEKSQMDVAEAGDFTQPQVSHVEAGKFDLRVSTLERYVEALGARLRVMVEFKDGTLVPIDARSLTAAA
jgi:Helix-turn-helix